MLLLRELMNRRVQCLDNRATRLRVIEDHQAAVSSYDCEIAELDKCIAALSPPLEGELDSYSQGAGEGLSTDVPSSPQGAEETTVLIEAMRRGELARLSNLTMDDCPSDELYPHEWATGWEIQDRRDEGCRQFTREVIASEGPAHPDPVPSSPEGAEQVWQASLKADDPIAYWSTKEGLLELRNDGSVKNLGKASSEVSGTIADEVTTPVERLEPSNYYQKEPA